MKTLEEVYEKYVMKPDASLYCGVKYTGEDVDLCDDHDEAEGYDFKVRQKIESGSLKTKLERTVTMNNGKIVTESSYQEVELEEGQILVYVEGLGFTIPDRKVCEIEEAIKLFKIQKGDFDELIGNEEEGSETH